VLNESEAPEQSAAVEVRARTGAGDVLINRG
jgi:hypothetical protein